ncbi:MAG: hypothetical protein ACOX52_24825 [Verrucomicrobiota bacterium]
MSICVHLWFLCLFIGGGQQVQQPVGRRDLPTHRRDADDTVTIGIAGQARAAVDPRALLVGQLHVGIELRRPAVTEEACDRDLQHAGVSAQRAVRGPLLPIVPDHRATGMPVEDPLGGIVRVRLG